MTGKYISIYEKNHTNKEDERLGLFEQLNDNYSIKKVLYPGAYAHLTPAFVFPVLIFNDQYKKLEPFYNSDEIYKYINKRKKYSEEPTYSYINADFNSPLQVEEESFDLLISQYSGFVSRACRKYLRIDGILVANSSHGDACMASISPDYEFIAVINKLNKRWVYSTRDLNNYFIPKKNITVTEIYLDKHPHGVGYTKSSTDYIFKRIH